MEKDAESLLTISKINFIREVDQIQEATKQLRNRGETINLRIDGFITSWEIVGPFDNSERMLRKVYSPETESVSRESYKGKNGQAKWTFLTSHNLGMLDINDEYGQIKEALAYAKTISSQTVHKRTNTTGSKNAWKVWVNGDLLYSVTSTTGKPESISL